MAPDSMQTVTEALCFSPLIDEVLHYFSLLVRPCFKSSRVVKNEVWVALEDQLVIYVMLSTLCGISIWVFKMCKYHTSRLASMTSGGI